MNEAHMVSYQEFMADRKSIDIDMTDTSVPEASFARTYRNFHRPYPLYAIQRVGASIEFNEPLYITMLLAKLRIITEEYN